MRLTPDEGLVLHTFILRGGAITSVDQPKLLAIFDKLGSWLAHVHQAEDAEAPRARRSICG